MPRARAEALFGMGTGGKDLLDELGGRRSGGAGPVDDPARGPLRVAPVRLGHVRRIGRVLVVHEASKMRGDAL